MSSIFGGSKSKQRAKSVSNNVSYNRAYDPVSSAFAPLLGEATQGLKQYNDFLSGDTSGFDQFKKNTGYDFAESEGIKKIIGSAAGRGTFQSGAAGKALESYGDNLQNQYANNFLDRLLGKVTSAFGAGSQLTGAGGYSSGSSTSTSEGTSRSKPGIGGFLGQVAGGIAASDRRLKTRVYKIGELKNGLTLYQYHYLNGTGPYIGVMADEVAQIQPEALGPVVDGYATVNYDKLEKELV